MKRWPPCGSSHRNQHAHRHLASTDPAEMTGSPSCVAALTSILIKLVVNDEAYRSQSERLWLDSDYVICAEIGYVEARAALAAARRGERLDAAALRTTKDQLELLWEQVSSGLSVAA